MQPLQQVQNVAPAASLPPHLRPARQDAKTPESKPPGYIPPHLRGFNKLSKEDATLNRPVPPHLQVKFVPRITSQDIGVPKQEFQVQNNDMQKHPAPDHNMPVVAQPPAVPVDEATMHPVQPISRAELSPEEKFLAFINQKSSKDMEAKKKAVADKARSTVVQAQSVQVQTITAGAHQSQPAEVQPFMSQTSRSKFRPTEQSNKDMLAFVSNKINGPATNGRKYVCTGGLAFSQTPLAASKPAGNSGGALQVADSNQKGATSPFDKVDPHSAFNPCDLAAKISSVK
jgi:hypothetical protein